MFLGESIALTVAVAWTATALFAEVGSKRMGSLPFNLVRMSLSLAALLLTLWLTMGVPWPRYADRTTWGWLVASGVVGYVLGDYCLMQGYILIGSRFGQLFMTLSAPTASIFGRLLLGERMGGLALLGMTITLTGIAITILGKEEKNKPSSEGSKWKLRLPPRGILFASLAGVGQGLGLVLSKQGLLHYGEALAVQGLGPDMASDRALVALPLYVAVPFAATAIRAVVAVPGFFVMHLLLNRRQAMPQLRKAVSDKKAMWSAAASMFFGPFVGVSLSLLATQYTATGIAQTLFALTPVLIIAPAAWLFHQRVTAREVVGALISVAGTSLFFL